MSRKVTITYTATYDLSKGEIADEYKQFLDSYRDSRSRREWFAVDRMIGHHNLDKFDPAAKITYKEEACV